MRSYFLTHLTNDEIETYLRENCAIIVPVGVTEMHGGFPVDCETVISEAIALKMAHSGGILSLTGLNFFYAGSTATGRGTIQVSVRQGIDYLGAVARDLHRQGFTRQIYISAHGPAHLTIGPMLRDLHDEVGTTVVQIETLKLMTTKCADLMKDAGADAFHDITVGAYKVLGRLEDVPLTDAYALPVPSSHSHLSDLLSLAWPSESAGYYCLEKSDHMPTPAICTREERMSRAARGERLIDAMVERMNVPHLLAQMESLEHYNRTTREKCLNVRDHP
ncbi:MAG: creatininase family protein [Clostridia bacterium]|nr:creatininase family protein [Clostridia bacterium]